MIDVKLIKQPWDGNNEYSIQGNYDELNFLITSSEFREVVDKYTQNGNLIDAKLFKQRYKNEKKRVQAFFRLIDKINTVYSPDTLTRPYLRRAVVKRGKYKIGDDLNGHIIIKLSRPWRIPHVDYKRYRVAKGTRYIQYAYFQKPLRIKLSSY